MERFSHPAINQCIGLYNENQTLKIFQKQIEEFDKYEVNSEVAEKIINVYRDMIAVIEEEFWSNIPDKTAVIIYQKLFQEMEEIIAGTGSDDRHKFVIVIPVADRPQHVDSCLGSLLNLCESFNYGGFSNGKYTKVSAIIADDSRDQQNINRNLEILRQYNHKGLETIYFGSKEQLELYEMLSKDALIDLQRVVGNVGKNAFYHKGASITRNLAYIKLKQLSDMDQKHLFYFVDSDQEFGVTLEKSDNDQEFMAINYFHELDKIFANSDVVALTGKVVGDPPVSPSVMAGTFIDDIILFLSEIAEKSAGQPCDFHKYSQRKEGEAAYHDMANLFGFKPTTDSYRYKCTLTGNHDLRACFSGFSNKLKQFFYGNHPTRKSYYNHVHSNVAVVPARTIYTGNYVITTEGLDYFIPFATLKLRMAGPVLGRLLKSELGHKFVSANLPMIHKRTVADTGEAEFRPGIYNNLNRFDLSGEFERQFFGDVMLFTVEKLIEHGYPRKSMSKNSIEQVLEQTVQSIDNQYANIRHQIMSKVSHLQDILDDRRLWWNKTIGLEKAIKNYTVFIDNIENIYGEDSPCYNLIGDSVYRKQRFRAITDAIFYYRDDKNVWSKVLVNCNR